jgi:hypothetical protein
VRAKQESLEGGSKPGLDRQITAPEAPVRCLAPGYETGRSLPASLPSLLCSRSSRKARLWSRGVGQRGDAVEVLDGNLAHDAHWRKIRRGRDREFCRALIDRPLPSISHPPDRIRETLRVPECFTRHGQIKTPECVSK